MPLQHDREAVVIEHILSTPRNLTVAFDVYNAFPAARLTLITRFATSLEEVLSKRLGRQFDVRTEIAKDPWKAGALVRIRGATWPSQFSLCLQAENNNATNYFIGLHTHPATPITSDNTATLDEASPIVGDEPNESWPWWYWLDGPKRYLNSAEVLLELASGELVSEIANVLERLVHAADSFLSR